MRLTGSWIEASGVQRVCALLEEGGHQALMVGGCVRNALLGVPVSDIDIATDARPERVMELAQAGGLKVVPTGIDHGTVTVVHDGAPYEITTFRHDIETDGRRAVVAFADDVSADARRRDFSVNALYARRDGEVIDPLGGLPDITARRIRFIDDPVQRIREDFLRILRFFRFHAAYGDAEAGLDAEGLAACAAEAGGIDGLSKERIGAEMRKLLSVADPAPAVAVMAQCGVLMRVLPGAEVRGLPLLVHFEDLAGTEPDFTRRLAILGGDSPEQDLRLSKAELRDWTVLRAGLESGEAAGALGYRHGLKLAQDILLLRAAVFEQPVEDAAFEEAKRGAEARFPVKAKDLMPGLQGAELGARLKALEAEWIDSGFTLGRDALLG